MHDTLTSARVLREATIADVPHLVALGARFLAETPYGAIIPSNPAQIETLMTHLVTWDDGVVLVTVRAGEIDGMLGAATFMDILSGELVAAEYFWWSHGVYGRALLERFETWAFEHGAARVQMMAPSERVGQVYARRHYTATETTWQKRLAPMPVAPQPDGARILVFDDVLPDPEAYRTAALAREYSSIDMQPAVFHGISVCGDNPTLPMWIWERFGLQASWSFFRQSPAGQPEPNFVHTDADMGRTSGIFYLTPDPPARDGTTFWRNTVTGQIATQTGKTTADNLEEVLAWRDRTQWAPWRTVPAQFNRLVLFDSMLFHSRAIEDNYGCGDDARLIQVIFSPGALPAGVSP